jgi:type II secretory pathway pseudopilin PulG
MHRPRNPATSSRRTRPDRPSGLTAFTIIELMVVVAILSMLITMLMPTLDAIRDRARRANAVARMQTLSNAAYQYQQDHRFFPGQRDPELLAGSDPAGPYTGSQVLAAAIYDYDVAETDTPPDAATPKYAQLSEGDLYNPVEVNRVRGDLPAPDRPNTLSDTISSSEPAPFLYYPARLGEAGLAQFVFEDNEDYLDDDSSSFNDQDEFEEFITNDTIDEDSNEPHNSGEFLLISPGPDGTFGNDDDVKNF